MQFSLTNTGITILFVQGFTLGRGYSLLTEESISINGDSKQSNYILCISTILLCYYTYTGLAGSSSP